MFFKGFNGVFVKRGEKNNIRAMFRVKHPHHFQTTDARHLDIEKQHIRAQFMHRADPFYGV
ncbi:Uncharacterised protein [Klebsiella pneumoniae]|nr:Uncharacterised protein [Klebsiella pneumoniae]